APQRGVKHMASCICHVVCAPMRCRLERIVRPPLYGTCARPAAAQPLGRDTTVACRSLATSTSPSGIRTFEPGPGANTFSFSQKSAMRYAYAYSSLTYSLRSGTNCTNNCYGERQVSQSTVLGQQDATSHTR